MGYRFTPGCCCPSGCKSVVLGFCGFELTGDHSTSQSTSINANSTKWRPDPWPDSWPQHESSHNSQAGCPSSTSLGRWTTITLDLGDIATGAGGKRIFTFFGDYTYTTFDGDPLQTTLVPNLTVPWRWNYTTSGKLTRHGLTFIPNPAPTGWVADAFVGNTISFGSNGGTIVANDTTTLTMSSVPNITWTIDFTNYLTYHSFKIENGVFYPRTGSGPAPNYAPVYAPIGWHTDQLKTAWIKIRDEHANTDSWYQITANSTTGATLDSPPADGIYSSSYSWYLFEPTKTNVIPASGGGCPWQPNKVWQASSYLDHVYDGCTIHITGGSSDIIASYVGNFTTLTNTTFDDVDWKFYGLIVSSEAHGFGLAAGGEAPVNGTALLSEGYSGNYASSPAGLPIVINGKEYTCASADSGHIYVTETIDVDFPWTIQLDLAGNYWDIISGTWAFTTDSGGDHIASSGTGAKVMWHNALLNVEYDPLYMYSFGVSLNDTAPFARRLFFGPNGAYSIELSMPTAGSNAGTLTLTCDSQVSTFPITLSSLTVGELIVCIYKLDDNYHVIAGYTCGWSPLYGGPCCCLSIDSDPWEALPHKIGLGSDGSIPYWNIGLGVGETRSTAWAATSVCANCSACYLPGQLTAIPSFSVTIPGVGTYGLSYHVRGTSPNQDLAGSSCEWGYETSSPYPYLGPDTDKFNIRTICFNLARSDGTNVSTSVPLLLGTDDQQTAFVGFNGQNQVNGYSYRGYIAFPTEAELMGSTMTLNYVNSNGTTTPPTGWPSSITLVKV